MVSHSLLEYPRHDVSRTVCHSKVAFNLLWTQPWCLAIQVDCQPQRLIRMVVLDRGCKKKETTCPAPGSRARLVVLALEVGAKCRKKPRRSCNRSPSPHQIGAASDAVAHGTNVAFRWFSSCAAARAFTASLLELRNHVVERDPHHAGLCV